MPAMGYRWIAAYRRGKLRGLKDIVRAMRAGFPDIVFSIQEQITEGDKVASRFEWTGTHKGEFLGISRSRPACSRVGYCH